MQALIEHMAYLDNLAIVHARMSAALTVTGAAQARAALSDQERAAFAHLWSEEVLMLILSAGVTVQEVRRALRTGFLPDKGSVDFLSSVRTPISGPSNTGDANPALPE